MSGPRMHEDTFAVLRHIEVHGPRNRHEVAKGLQKSGGEVSKKLANLLMMGYLALDETATPANFTLTGKARKKLSEPFEAPAPVTQPRKARTRPDPHSQLTKILSATKVSAPLRQQRQAPAPRGDYVPPRREQRYGAMGRAWRYEASEYAPSNRLGAMDAFSFPSRVGDTLRYRDGRVTDLAGNPLTD